MRNKINFILFILFLPVLSFAQENPNSNYLFEKFQSGKVIFKNGSNATGNLNYDIVRETFVFRENNEILDLANPNSVAVVNINNRIFEHAKGDIFYERVNLDNDATLYIQWNNKLLSKGKKGAYGTVSQTTSIDNVSQITGPGGNVNLSDTSEYTYKNNNTYYLKQKGKYKRFISSDSFSKLYKGHEQEVKDYLKSENINLKILDDVKKAVIHCAQYLNE